jgi:hypothetical protein
MCQNLQTDMLLEGNIKAKQKKRNNIYIKVKYMVMSRDRNAGRGHSVKIDNSSIGRVE